MLEVAVIGCGMTPFGEHYGKSLRNLVEDAYLSTIGSVDKGIDPKDIQAVWYGTLASSWASFPIPDFVGLSQLPVSRLENACATGSDAFRNACFSVMAGIYDVVLIIGAEKMNDEPCSSLWNYQAMENWNIGRSMPGVFALRATRHMHEFGTEREQLAMVSVKNHHNGALNPRAHFRFETTVEKALKSRMIAYPLGLLDCCPMTDGAAAAIICRADIAKKYTDAPVQVVGLGLATDTSYGTMTDEQLVGFPTTTKAAKEAFRMARLEPKDVDVVELHDCFTITELVSYEDLGFCRKGEGGKFVEEGMASLGGEIPVNPSGGLLAKGHPTGATGVAQIVEVFEQVRGQSGKRQVADAEIGLTHNLGVAPEGSVGLVTILRRGT
jgi:acetyl-CoA C-acetyltransferase